MRQKVVMTTITPALSVSFMTKLGGLMMAVLSGAGGISSLMLAMVSISNGRHNRSRSPKILKYHGEILV